MTVHKTTMWLAACFMIVAQGASLYGQGSELISGDLQFFSPVDLDFDDRPIRKTGWYVGYDKLAWYFSNENIRLGTGGTSDGSTNPWRLFGAGGTLVPIDPTDPDSDVIFIPGTEVLISPRFLPSAIDNAVERGELGWGDRYEFGQTDGENGWWMSVLDGPEQNANASYGFGFTGQDDTVSTGVGLPTDIPNNPNNQLLSPLGSVLIVFDDPLDLMVGFLDVADGTNTGVVPGGAYEVDDNGDGVLDGDGFADDINRNGQFGPDGFSTDRSEVPDQSAGIPPDFDDLVVLPTSWQTVAVRNTSRLAGVEMMWSHTFNNLHRRSSKQNNQIELHYGLRYVKFRDKFAVTAAGGVLGDSFWNTKITNNLLGPQVALNWAHQRNRMRYDVKTRVMFAYNALEWDQTSALGEDLIPGQHNHPLYFAPTYSHHGKRTDDFSPLVEFRGQASYQVTSSIAARLGYTATFIDNIRRASEQVKYELPSMGFIDGGTQEIFVSGLNFGFDVVY